MPAAPITSRSNARVKAFRAAFDGKAHAPGDLIAIEGEHLLAEALRSGLSFETVFVRQGSERLLDALPDRRTRETLVLAPDVFASAVETQSPQGIAATLLIPGPRAAQVRLILEDLQDPGNLGTLLRTLEAFGGGSILATRASANPWSPKVMRASAGSVFRVPVERLILPAIRTRIEQEGTRVYAAVAQQQHATSVFDTVFEPNAAILLGNEGAGLSSEALSLAHHRAWIPCATESLNVAAAGCVLLYELMRQRAAKAETR